MMGEAEYLFSVSSVSSRDCSIGRRYAIGFPEPVSDARRHCPQPGRLSGVCLDEPFYWVGFADGPSI